jgi:ATPase family AAA domain-containing protein 3A/B
MLYGPPGTGKTLFATELAKRCGMEYAFMSGSSFSKFKDGEGIEALDELFAWANKSSGLLIFIDEAETFLSKRENMDPQSKAYLLLNNFLNYTGTRSNKFMVVFATNHKDALDSAMYRRIDDLIEMPLPGLNERIRILNLYKDIILLDTAQNEKNFVSSVVQVLNENKIANIAQKTKGFSGSELEGIMNNIKTGADILDPSILTNSFVDSVVQQSIDKYIAFTSGKFIGTVED